MTDNLLTETNEEINIDSNKNYFEELTKPGAKFDRTKYKSDEELKEDISKGKFHADQTVEVMKRRLDELRVDYLKLREDNMTKAKLEDLIDQMNQKNLNSEFTPAKEEDKSAVKLEDIENLMSNKFQEYETNKKATENFNIVKNKAMELYGDKYPSVLKQRGTELGLSDEEVNALAKRSPAAFIKMMGLDVKKEEVFTAPPRTSQNSFLTASSSRDSTAQTWSQYQEMKKTNPLLYYDRETAVKMAKDAVTLGAKFRDGDYYVKGLHEPNL